MIFELLIGSAKRELTLPEVIDIIIHRNKGIQAFWSSSHEWASTAAADVLNEARLDWQVSLSYTLKRWLEVPDADDPEYDGALILAWANLGALTENTLKFFLSVYLDDYMTDQDAIKLRQKILKPGDASFEALRIFYYKKIWDDNNKKERNNAIQTIQQRRNGIHAFNNRDLAAFKEFHEAIFYYRDILEELITRVPLPE
ncbi:hypothetical protein M2444_004699 [Paenibacillus sp. PastF-3]|uniref:hypothetical protein n=1 Tax=Paenibacillus sp. PastF-3 TaxID=2940626 RepID=UPI002476C0B2|nr:hypothetical protein [Paenibacillus sp. PastF-3]MDH6372870.1 hypothetical protein [Paenibacillus sp. PastF-3]